MWIKEFSNVRPAGPKNFFIVERPVEESAIFEAMYFWRIGFLKGVEILAFTYFFFFELD